MTISIAGTVVTMLFFSLFLENGWTLPSIIAGVALFFFLMALIIKVNRLEEERKVNEYKTRSRNKAFREEFKKIYAALESKADKPLNKKSNVRAGSHPSEQYYAMIGRKEMKEHDAGSEDPSAS